MLFPEKKSIVWLDIPYILISSLTCYVLAVVFHELGHVLADLFVGFKIRKINLLFVSIQLTNGPKVSIRKISDGIEGAVLIKSPDIKDEKEVKNIRRKFMFTNISGPMISFLIFVFLLNTNGYLFNLLSLMNFICFLKSISGDLSIFYKTLTVHHYIYIVMVASDLASGEIPNRESGLFIGKKLDNLLKEKYCYEFFLGETASWGLNFILVLSFFYKTPLINRELLTYLKTLDWEKIIEEIDSEKTTIIKKNIFFLEMYFYLFERNNFERAFDKETLSLIDEDIDNRILILCTQNEEFIKVEDSFFEIPNDEFYTNVYKQILQILNGGK